MNLNRARGERHPKATLTDADVSMILELHDNCGLGYKALAKKFERPRSTIRSICMGRTRGLPCSAQRRRWDY